MSKKLYGPTDEYKRKLWRIMERLGVKEYNFNWDRWGAWVQFRYKNNLYMFDHSVAKARARGLKLDFGSDAFAQIVLSLEDIARMVERGIYDLQTWVAGLKMLPPATEIPQCFKTLLFNKVPSLEEVEKRYREFAKAVHPDAGGSEEGFINLRQAYDQAKAYLGVK